MLHVFFFLPKLTFVVCIVRTIMALWKARALTPEQKVQIVDEEAEASTVQTAEEESLAKNLQASEEELDAKSFHVVDEESEAKTLHTEESGSFLGIEDVNMSVVYSSVLSLPVSIFSPSLLSEHTLEMDYFPNFRVPEKSIKWIVIMQVELINGFFLKLQTSFFMELFRGSEIDRRVMERAGCLNYSHSPWESEKADVYQRQLYYKFDKRISRYRGEVTSTQQKSRLSSRTGWLIEEVMTLHGVPLGDYFTVMPPNFLI